MVKSWDIFEIGKKLFGVDTNRENNVSICTHLQNHANSEIETKRKRRKSSENNERTKKKNKTNEELFFDVEAGVVGDTTQIIIEDYSIMAAIIMIKITRLVNKIMNNKKCT